MKKIILTIIIIAIIIAISAFAYVMATQNKEEGLKVTSEIFPNKLLNVSDGEIINF